MKDRLGMLVFSTAGRDFGRPYLVIQDLDPNTVLVSDGKLRHLHNPKRKNIRHLSLTGLTENDIRVKLQGGTFPSNTELRKVIDELVTDRNLEQRS
ncbi:KOW domain-containing RNA-binding protein [Clostridia bacterium]|nr:KOW domain-containing RNA-binding protein [Clostridia bacterium]